MSAGDAGHGEFRELAAGYALNSLDPADEERFLEHAAACPDCLEQIAQFQEVAAALAETAPAAEPSSDLGQRILAATQPGPADAGPAATVPAQIRLEDARGEDTGREGTGRGNANRGGTEHGGTEHGGTERKDAEPTGPGPDAAPPGVLPLRPRRRWPRRAAVAAAAAVVAIGGIWGGLAATSGGTPAPLAECSRPHTCTEVPLVATATHHVAAKVVVLGHEVWMVNGAMTASPKNEIYVLWQITGSRPPQAVGSFDVRAGSHAPIRIGGLTATPAAGSTVFAVSLEHGQTIPAAPSNRLALGRVS